MHNSNMHETCARFRLMLCYFCETNYWSVTKDRPAHTGIGLRGAGHNSISVCVPKHSCRSGEDWMVTHCNSRVVTAQTRRRRRRMQLRPQLRPRQRQDRQHTHIHSQRNRGRVAFDNKLDHHWFIFWLVTHSVPSHYLKQFFTQVFKWDHRFCMIWIQVTVFIQED